MAKKNETITVNDLYKSLQEALTFKQGTEVPPAGDATLGGELSHGCLHEEHWDTTSEQEQDVWDQKCT